MKGPVAGGRADFADSAAFSGFLCLTKRTECQEALSNLRKESSVPTNSRAFRLKQSNARCTIFFTGDMLDKNTGGDQASGSSYLN